MGYNGCESWALVRFVQVSVDGCHIWGRVLKVFVVVKPETTKTSLFGNVVLVGYQRASFMLLICVQVFCAGLYMDVKMTPSLLFPAWPPVTNNLPSCR